MFLFRQKGESVNPRLPEYFHDGIFVFKGSTNSEFGEKGCENPMVCGSKGCFLLANCGKNSFFASGSTAISKEASKNRRRQHGATNGTGPTGGSLELPGYQVPFLSTALSA